MTIIDHPARITRFVPTLPDRQVCIYDEATRINIVAEDVFITLDRTQQKVVLRTDRSIDAAL